MPRPPSIPGTAPTGTGSPWLEPEPEQPPELPTIPADPPTDGGTENGTR